MGEHGNPGCRPGTAEARDRPRLGYLPGFSDSTGLAPGLRNGSISTGPQSTNLFQALSLDTHYFVNRTDSAHIFSGIPDWADLLEIFLTHCPKNAVLRDRN